MSKKENKTPYPQRTRSHRIDSLAMRFIRTNIPDYWIDRDLSERDYGIDLAIEIFNQDDNGIESETSTGLLSLIQVKGTTTPLEERDEYYKYSRFPVRTLNYAMQFKIPFFLIVVSINEQSLCNSTAHFLWLQDFVRKQGYGFLKNDWCEHREITLFIPKGNDFVEKRDFFKECVQNDHSEMERYDIIRQFSLINDYFENLKNTNIENVMKVWLNLLEKIQKRCFYEPDCIAINEMIDFCSTMKKTQDLSKVRIKKLQSYKKDIQRIVTMIMDLSELNCTPPIKDL